MSEEIMGYVMADPTKFKVGETYTTCREKGKFIITSDRITDATKRGRIMGVRSGNYAEFVDEYCISAWDCIFSVSVNIEDIIPEDDCYSFPENSIASDKVKIVDKLTVSDVIEQQVDFARKSESFYKIIKEYSDNAFDKDDQQIFSRTRSSNIATSGVFSTIVIDDGGWSDGYKACATTGDVTNVFATADSVRISASGRWTYIATSGKDACLSTSAVGCFIDAIGEKAKIAAVGTYTRMTCKGRNGRIIAAGNHSSCSAIGKNGVIAIVGQYCRFKGVNGTPVCVADYDKNGKFQRFVTGCIGEKGLKPDTIYTVESGRFVEFSEYNKKRKASKTKHKNDQKYVWRWYVDDGDGLSVGPYRSKQKAVKYARSSWPDGCDEVEIAMGKTRSADLSVPIDDDFAEKTLKSLITSVHEPYEEPELSQFCTERQKHDLARRLKTAVAAWQSEHRIAVPVGDITDFTNNYFVHPLPKNADKAEAAE